MNLCKVTLGGFLPHLLTELLPIGLVVLEDIEEPTHSCCGHHNCTCKHNTPKPFNCKNTVKENNWDEENEGICLGTRNYYYSNYKDSNFNKNNNYGEPSPLRNRTYEEIAEQERHPEPDGIVVNVSRPKQEMFSTRAAFASAASKYRLLEDVAHQCNWGGMKEHTPIFTELDD